MRVAESSSFRATLKDKQAWIICGVFLFIAFTSLNDVMVYSPDSARYLVWAKSISRLDGFVDRTGAEPVRYVVHAPLYSVILAPVALLAPDSVTAAKFFTALWGAVLLFLFYHWLSKRVSRGAAFLGGLVLAVNPLVIVYSTQLLSDIPFGVILVLSLLMLERFEITEKPSTMQTASLLALMVASVFVREIGLTIFLATVLFFTVRRNFRLAVWALLVPLAFYLAWFVRNEIIVAGSELPPLRNSEVFTMHYFTSQESSLVSEFLARMQISLPLYLKSVGSLVFLPQFGTVPYGVVITTDPPYSLLDPIASVLIFFVVPLTLGLFLYGVFSSLKEHPATLWVLAFFPLYLFMILVYPFYDIRFLFPLLVLMTYYGTVGGVDLYKKLAAKEGFRSPRQIMLAAVTGLLIPNAAWCYSFVRENVNYGRSQEAFYASIANKDSFPNSLTKTMSEAGQWMIANTDTPSVLGTRWKEVTFWLPGYKLVELNGLVPLDEFESYLRDYRVQYLLSSVGVRGIRDYEEQMELSTRFKFRTVYRVANMEVIRVYPLAWLGANAEREAGSVEDTGIAKSRFPSVEAFWRQQLRQREEYLSGIRALRQDSLEKAKAVFQHLSDETNRLSKALLYLAITHEAEGDYPRARQMLWAVPIMSQAGPFLGHAAYHRQIIDLLEQADWESRKQVRAELYYTVSVRFWLLGLRTQALNVLRKSLDADPAFLPALAFGVFFNVQQGKIDAARAYLKSIEKIDPRHPLAQSLGSVLAYRDSIRSKAAPEKRVLYRFEMAKAYLQAGLGDSAIDELLRLLAEKPDDIQALGMLANLYESRRKFEPAMNAFQRLAQLDPENAAVRERIQALLER